MNTYLPEPEFCTELKYRFLKITRNAQSSFRISFNGKVAYIDPIQISEENHDADYIFISHEHFDHLDLSSIKKIIKESSVIITTQLCLDQLQQDSAFENIQIIILEPNDHLEIDKNISVDTKPAYNLNKFKEPGLLYHPKENKGIGFVITFTKDTDQVKIYHMGDTDFLTESQVVEPLDILMIPVGGKYVMDVTEAIEANNIIKPKISIPMHFGLGAGTKEDAKNFVNRVENQGVIL